MGGIVRRDVFVWHGGNVSERRGARQARERSKIGRQRSEDPCGVENMEMRARELSVLDCLLMGCSRSWELVGQALPLAGMSGKNAYPTTLARRRASGNELVSSLN